MAGRLSCLFWCSGTLCCRWMWTRDIFSEVLCRLHAFARIYVNAWKLCLSLPLPTFICPSLATEDSKPGGLHVCARCVGGGRSDHVLLRMLLHYGKFIVFTIAFLFISYHGKKILELSMSFLVRISCQILFVHSIRKKSAMTFTKQVFVFSNLFCRDVLANILFLQF